MSANEYKITYRDGATQTFATSGPQPQGEWLIFLDGIGEQIRVRAEEVESVIRVGTPERTSGTIKAA
jgi:hypothetical protein